MSMAADWERLTSTSISGTQREKGINGRESKLLKRGRVGGNRTKAKGRRRGGEE